MEEKLNNKYSIIVNKKEDIMQMILKTLNILI